MADFGRRKDQPRQLKPLFSIRKPYALLNADGVKAFRESRWPRLETEAPEERFGGVADLFTLSNVYFNERHTLALTAMATWCGSLCALYQWKVFEKAGKDKWEERPWITCSTIAGGRLSLGALPAREYVRSHRTPYPISTPCAGAGP